MQKKEAYCVKALRYVLEKSVDEMSGHAPFGHDEIESISGILSDHYCNFESSLIDTISRAENVLDIMQTMSDWLHVDYATLTKYGAATIALSFLSLDWSEILSDILIEKVEKWKC